MVTPSGMTVCEENVQSICPAKAYHTREMEHTINNDVWHLVSLLCWSRMVIARECSSMKPELPHSCIAVCNYSVNGIICTRVGQKVHGLEWEVSEKKIRPAYWASFLMKINSRMCYIMFVNYTKESSYSAEFCVCIFQLSTDTIVVCMIKCRFNIFIFSTN